MKDEEAKRELEEAKRDFQSKIDYMKDDVQNMGVKRPRGDVWRPCSKRRRIGKIRSVTTTVS